MAKEMTIDQTIETFAQLIVDGYKQRDAYRCCHPDCKTKNDRSVDVRACEFAKDARVRKRIEEIRAEMAERHMQFRDRLIDHLCEEIDTCWHDNKTLSPVMKQVDTATRVLGMDKQVVDVTAQVGALDESSAADKINFLLGKQGKGRRK